MTDFTYKGVLVTENWPTAASATDATRPSYERWTATFDDLTTLHGNTQREIKDSITARLEATGDQTLHDAARQLMALVKQFHPASQEPEVLAWKLLQQLIGRTDADLAQVVLKATAQEAQG